MEIKSIKEIQFSGDIIEVSSNLYTISGFIGLFRVYLASRRYGLASNDPGRRWMIPNKRCVDGIDDLNTFTADVLAITEYESHPLNHL